MSLTKKLNHLVELNTEKSELRKDGTYRFYHAHEKVSWRMSLEFGLTVAISSPYPLRFFSTLTYLARASAYKEPVYSADLEKIASLVKICEFLLQTKVYLF